MNLEGIATISPAMEPFLSSNTLKVIKRNGQVVSYDPQKIRLAITKAFLAVEGPQVTHSKRVHDIVTKIVEDITAVFRRRLLSGTAIHIEDIQDQVELALMRSGEYKVARAYVLYREERRKARESAVAQVSLDHPIRTLMPDGSLVPLNIARLHSLLEEACTQLEQVQPILQDTLRNLYDGIPFQEVEQALIMSVRPMIERDPQYSQVAARLLLGSLRYEALAFLNLNPLMNQADMYTAYRDYFKAYIERGISLGLLTPDLKKFDLDRLIQALKPERDFKFTYLGLQTLYDRYFLHSEKKRFELPQAFFMRIAMGLALNEANKEEQAIAFYELLSSFDYMASTPTLFNAGTQRPQLSSCFLTTVPDDLEGIYNAIRDNALLSKFAGGIGNDWTSVRALGAHIHGTNGESLGVVPFLNVANATAVAVNQGGKRKGAVCAYLEIWHRDIEEFLELRKNTGDERRRTHDMNTANWIPDLFMKRLLENKEWTLFSPDEVPDLHNLYGAAFEEAYLRYEEKVKRGEMRSAKTISAVSLWRKMLTMLFETGHPWITFKDACNLRSPQQHAGVIHSSNLCTEITLNTSLEEIAVCNLGSINLVAHMTEDGQINRDKLKQTVRTAMRMLDNVIDINYYTVPQARASNLKHRPVGLGIMGFQDALYHLRLPYASEAAKEFADRSMELISYYAIEASSDLAKERGAYESFVGSLWSKGVLPLDSIEYLAQNRGGYLAQDRSSTLDWDALRKKVRIDGMRNSNVLAIAPTATISNICGVSQSIEPTYQNLYVKSNMSGEFIVVNPYLVKDLKERGLWDEVMVNDLKYYDGSVSAIDRIPQDLKNLYATAFEIEPRWLVGAASRRQKWIDQAQSLNLYMAKPSGKLLDELYRSAWIQGLKTTYYLRTLGATHAEKATVAEGVLNAVSLRSVESAAACSIDDPSCETCQ